MNHFDYFTEIENAFVRRRGRHLLLSPVDWALIEEWEKQGVPLKIVLATIDEIFDQVEADPKRSGSVRTLSYCKGAVESRYRTWLESQVGGNGSGNGDPVREEPQDGSSQESGYRIELASAAEKLIVLSSKSEGPFAEALANAGLRLKALSSEYFSGDSLEVELEHLDEAIDTAILANAAGKEIEELKDRIRSEIGERSAAMNESTYTRTEDLLLRKYLREASGIPRLGLFYL